MGKKIPGSGQETAAGQTAAREPLITYSRKDYAEYHEQMEKFFAQVGCKPQFAGEHDGVTSLLAAKKHKRRKPSTAKYTKSVFYRRKPREQRLKNFVNFVGFC